MSGVLIAEIVKGWTTEIGPFTLKIAGSPVDLTGFDAEDIILLVATGGSETYSETDGDIRIDADPTTGKVYYSPDAEDFDVGNYTVRFKVTDGTGKVAFFPNGVPDYIRVHKP